MSLRKFFIYLTIISIFTFLFINIFGLNMSMRMDKDGHMAPCPFMNDKKTICSMSFTEHLAKWSSLFNTNLQINDLLATVVLLATAIILVFCNPFRIALAALLCLHRYYRDKNPSLKVSNYLTLAFSDGILNPRLYN